MDEPAADLITRATRGEAAAFEALVRTYHGQVYRWALVAADDPDEADDVAQLVWIKVHRKLASYRGDSKFSTWLYRVTFNLAVEGHRTRERRATILSLTPLEVVAEAGPEEAPDQEHLIALVRQHLAGLPARQRAIFALADLEGIATAEIAARLEMNEVTVRTNLFKARRAMRERLLRDEPSLMEELRS